MNRLSPLISRRAGLRPALAGPPLPRHRAAAAAASAPPDDLRLFLTGWLGGLLFFGTLLA